MLSILHKGLQIIQDKDEAAVPLGHIVKELSVLLMACICWQKTCSPCTAQPLAGSVPVLLVERCIPSVEKRYL